jgi:hypothetical protein
LQSVFEKAEGGTGPVRAMDRLKGIERGIEKRV